MAGQGDTAEGKAAEHRAAEHRETRRTSAQRPGLQVGRQRSQAVPTDIAPARSKGESKRLGDAGEFLAADWYQRRGYVVISKGWRCRLGELDLVVARGSTIVFCEVKTRMSRKYGWAAEAVDEYKQARIRRLAAVWLGQFEGRHPDHVRFDVVAIEPGRIVVIQDAW